MTITDFNSSQISSGSGPAYQDTAQPLSFRLNQSQKSKETANQLPPIRNAGNLVDLRNSLRSTTESFPTVRIVPAESRQLHPGLQKLGGKVFSELKLRAPCRHDDFLHTASASTFGASCFDMKTLDSAMIEDMRRTEICLPKEDAPPLLANNMRIPDLVPMPNSTKQSKSNNRII